MKKKTKLGEPHSEATPEARAAANKKNVATQYHLAQGNKQAPRSTELSETTGQDPQSRAASRGAKAPKKRAPKTVSGAGY